MTLEPAKVLNPESKRAHIGRGIAVAIRSHGQVFTVEHEINGNALICDLRALPRDAIAIGRMIGRDDDPWRAFTLIGPMAKDFRLRCRPIVHQVSTRIADVIGIATTAGTIEGIDRIQ